MGRRDGQDDSASSTKRIRMGRLIKERPQNPKGKGGRGLITKSEEEAKEDNLEKEKGVGGPPPPHFLRSNSKHIGSRENDGWS